jgi:hypothetical protein
MILKRRMNKMSQLKYTLVVDFGIPYEEKLDKKSLMKELKLLEKKAKDSPYADVWIYDGRDKDVTDKVFKEYHKKRGR